MPPLKNYTSEYNAITDPAERDFVKQQRGLVEDEKIFSNLEAFRAKRAAEAPPPETAAPLDPHFESWLKEAKPLNPDYSDDQLKNIYDRTYAEKDSDLLSFEDFKKQAQPLNPEYSETDLRAVWEEQYASRGALEENPGFSGTLADGARQTGRSIKAFGQALTGDTAGAEATSNASASAPRDPALVRLLRDINRRKEELGPDASWFDAGGAVGKALLSDPKGAALLLTEQLPNSAAALGSAGAGALAGSAFGPAGTVIGGLAGLFLADVALETGGKVIEKAQGGLTPDERMEALDEGLKKGAVIAGIDAATFGATKWLTGAATRAMERATVRTLEAEGVDVTDKTAIDLARQRPEMVDKVQAAQKEALQHVSTLGQKTARGTSEVALQTIGEGAGEYIGELVATGHGDKVEAFIEAFAGLGQTVGEIGIAGAMDAKGSVTKLFGPGNEVDKPDIQNILQQPDVDSAIAAAGGAAEGDTEVTPEKIDAFLGEAASKPGDRTESHRVADQTIANQLFAKIRGNGDVVSTRADGIMLHKGVSSKVLDPASLPDQPGAAGFVTKGQYEAVETVLQAMGKHAIVLDSPLGKFEGMAYRSEFPSTVFLSSKMSHDPAAVAFHEVAHLMEGQPLYDAFQKTVQENLQPDGLTQAKGRHAGTAKRGSDQLLKEMSADIMGDAMLKPEFMEKVFKNLQLQVGPEAAQKEAMTFLDTIKAMIKRVHAAVLGHTFKARDGRDAANAYVKNLEAVHDSLAKAVAAEFKQAEQTVDVKPATGVQTKAVDPLTVKPKEEVIAREGHEGQKEEGQVTLPATIDDAAREVNVEPTGPQREAGNYKKGHVKISGLDISIENPEGSTRRGVDRSGKEWSVEMKSHYGYIKGTKGKDKDHVDIFVKPSTPDTYDGMAYVVDQITPDTKQFDEHKVVLGASSLAEAKSLYLENYKKGWQGIGAISPMPMNRLKEWLKGDTTTPVAYQAKKDLVPVGKKELTPRAASDLIDKKKAIHKLADEKGIPWDNDQAFMDFTEEVTGERHLDDLSSEQLDKMAMAVARKDAAPKKKDLVPTKKKKDQALLPKPQTELVEPAKDTPVGENAAGEKLYERADGSRYRVRPDNKNKPDFGGDLTPVEKKEDQAFLSKPSAETKVPFKGTEAPAKTQDTGLLSNPLPETKNARFDDSGVVNEATRDLRKLSHEKKAPSDVLLQNMKYVSLDDAVQIAKEGIESGALKPVPFQLNNVLDIAMTDAKRVLDAVQSSKDAGLLSNPLPKTEPAPKITTNRPYSEIAREIFEREGELWDQGLDVTKMYNPLDRRDDVLRKRKGYEAMPEDLGRLHLEREVAERQIADGPQLAPARVIPAVPYVVSEPGKLDAVIRTMQDKNIDIKRMVEAIQQAGGKIPSDLNPVLKEEVYQKRAEIRSEDYKSQELLPLIETMRENNVTLDQLNSYAHARHVIQDKLNTRLKDMNPTMPNNDALSGLSDAEANKTLNSYTGARKAAMLGLMARVDAMVEKTRDLMVNEYGLEKADTIAGWRWMYKAYVPLRREAFEEEGHPTGTGRSVRGSSASDRLGSNLKVGNILANIAQARDQVITRGEKMRPVVAMAGLLMLHPNKDIAVLDKPTPITTTDPNTGLEISVPGDLANYRVPKVRHFDPVSGEVKWYPDPAFKGHENVVNFRIKGVDYAIVFNQKNARAREMAKAFRDIDTGQITGILKAVAPYTRYLASINTQYNPIFGIVNFVRDAQFAMLALSSTPLAGRQGEVLNNARKSMTGIFQDARDARHGLPPSSATAHLWERFQHVGGPTGYRDLFFTATDRANEIERLLNPNTWKNMKSPQDFGRRVEETALFRLLSDYNVMMENSIRLGVFKTAVEMGIDDLQAASYAKNITVNFNKKGQIGAQMGAMYAFFNANVQSTARILETIWERDLNGKGLGHLSAAGKKIVVGGLLVGVLQTSLLALAGFDADEPPDFVKEKNFVIPAPGTEKGYIMLPMPLGFNLLPNLGRFAAEVSFALAQGKDPRIFKRSADLFHTLVSSLSPTGGSGSVALELSPTVADPLLSLEMNKDWTGKKISQEDFSSLHPTPGHSRARPNATPWAIGLSKMINWATGGTDYTPGAASPTPDAIDYLIQQATGGVGREASKTAQVAKAASTGETIAPYKYPLFGRFIGSASGDAATRDKFYDNIRSINLAAEEVKGRALHHEERGEFLKDHPEAAFEKSAVQMQRAIGDLQDAKRLAIDRGEKKDAIKLREERISALMKQFNDAVERRKKDLR